MDIKRYTRTTFMLSKALTKRFLRDKVALFFTFVFPLIFLLVFGGLFKGGDGASFNVAIINNSEAQFAQNFAAQLKEADVFEASDVGEFSEAETKIGRGELDAILLLPTSFGEVNEKGQPSGSLEVYYDEGDQQLAQTLTGVLDAMLDSVNQQFVDIDPPLILENKTIQTANLSQFDYIFAGLIGFSILSLGIFGMANGFPVDKKAGILRRLKATPLTASQLVIATALEYLIISVMSVALMLLVGMLLFDFTMRGDYLNFSLFMIIGIISMFGFGLAIGGWAKNENQSAPLSNLVAFPMMFLSGVFFPRFLMPEWLQTLSSYIPLTPIVDGLRLIMTESKTILELGPQLIIIAGWTVAIYLLAVKTFRWE